MGYFIGSHLCLHINARGDVEPCVFVHYSNCNIHDTTLLDALKSPIFMQYHQKQPFNENMFKPCPMLENPNCLREMVAESDAVSTDYQSPESADHLADKTTSYAENWTETANELWEKNRPENK